MLSTFIRSDLIAATSGLFICSLISCPFPWRGVNRRQVVSFHHYDLKTHFHPWYNAPLDPISCNTKFPDYWKPSKIVFLKSHPGHIVNCFIVVNTFAARHFTVSLQYFEFCPVESEENFFKCHAWTDLFVLCEQSVKRTTFEFFHFLEAREDS